MKTSTALSVCWWFYWCSFVCLLMVLLVLLCLSVDGFIDVPLSVCWWFYWCCFVCLLTNKTINRQTKLHQ
jgi:hypothetical protein